MNKTVDSNRIANIDILRIIAILMVMMTHIANGIFSFDQGSKGVQLFFIISGYLAFYSYEKKSSVKEYYVSRIKRIIPAYYICLVIIYIYDLIFITKDSSISTALNGQCGPGFLRYFFFLQTIIPSNNWYMWNNHMALWTMSIFFVFYLVVPVLYKICKGIKSTLVLLVITPIMDRYILSALSGYPVEAEIDCFAAENPLTNIYCFIAGILVYMANKYSKQMMIGIMSFVFLIITNFDMYLYEFIFIIVMLLATNVAPLICNETISKRVGIIANGTFTLYLIHSMTIALATKIWGVCFKTYTIGHAVFMTVFSIVFAYVLNDFIIRKIEKRIIKKES